MSYVVLARKWRPQTFDDLVGQEHVSRTLANAIGSDRVAHAFLFTGVRGVGKTSSARILAKALNCEQGPTPTPCQTCPACQEIGRGTNVDVQEIDGASYTGVDAVRSLQETIPYRPARDRYKIFIVDEVHMLSTAAWNAFLKTLEEPPPHVKFIFATTEVNKVPVTILSRCQRFDFKLISTEAIAARLRGVLEAEKVAADDGAIGIVAREAAGSMRDAMSLLDQVIAWVGDSGEQLDSDGVARVLGVAARSVLHRLGSALIDHDAGACLDVVAELAEQGFPLSHVARNFLDHLRDLVVAKVSATPERLLDLADTERADIVALAARSDVDDLSRLYLGFSRAYDDIGRSAQPRGAFEMALVRLACRPPLVPMDELLRRLAHLEQRLGGDGGGDGGGVARGGAGRGGQRASGQGGSSAAPARAAPPQPTAPAVQTTPRRSAVPSAPPAAASPPPAPQAKPRPMTPQQLTDWEAILEIVRKKRAPIASVYEHGSPLRIERLRLQLAYEPESFLAQRADAHDAKELLREAARSHFGVEVEVALDFSGRHLEVQTVAAKNSAEQAGQLEAARQAVAQHPSVVAAIDVLGAELREVRLPGEM